MQPQLTPKQQRFLDYLQREIAKTGLCPSLRQAAADLGVSHAAIAQILRVLEEKGYLKREGRYSRKVYLLNRAREAAALQRWREIPIIGRVTAGLPVSFWMPPFTAVKTFSPCASKAIRWRMPASSAAIWQSANRASTPKTARSSWR
jgi:DNA-binding transcriptional MocR family regulator